MEVLIAIGIAVLFLVLGYAYTYFRKKGYVSPDTLKFTSDLLLFAKIVIAKNHAKPDKVEGAFEIIRKVIKYAEEQDIADIEYKKTLAITYITDSLKAMEIEVDLETELLLQILVENALNIPLKRVEINEI